MPYPLFPLLYKSEGSPAARPSPAPQHGGRPARLARGAINAFQNAFGGGGFSQRSRAPQKGADLRYTLTISLEEAFAGAEKVIVFARQKGSKEENTKLSVTVPAGVKEGQRLKLAGEGDSPALGSPGDLYVIINLQQHLLFKREEFDVIMIYPSSTPMPF